MKVTAGHWESQEERGAARTGRSGLTGFPRPWAGTLRAATQSASCGLEAALPRLVPPPPRPYRRGCSRPRLSRALVRAGQQVRPGPDPRTWPPPARAPPPQREISLACFCFWTRPRARPLSTRPKCKFDFTPQTSSGSPTLRRPLASFFQGPIHWRLHAELILRALVNFCRASH